MALVQGQSDDVNEMRAAFHDLSLAISNVIEIFGHKGFPKTVKTFCPMAKSNTGAYWFQQNEEIVNPYFGHRMLRCGEVTFTFKEIK